MKWDYRVIYISSDSNIELENRLINLGQEGWEVCGLHEDKLILKRPMAGMTIKVKLEGADKFEETLNAIAKRLSKVVVNTRPTGCY